MTFKCKGTANIVQCEMLVIRMPGIFLLPQQRLGRLKKSTVRNCYCTHLWNLFMFIALKYVASMSKYDGSFFCASPDCAVHTQCLCRLCSTHTHHGQICCHNTDYVLINGHDRTVTVILAKHCIELPDAGFRWKYFNLGTAIMIVHLRTISSRARLLLNICLSHSI